MTPFDAPHAELAWMFLQSICEGGDVDEGFALLSDDFTCWSLYTRVALDKGDFRRAVDQRKQSIELTIDLLRCINEGDTVVVEGFLEGDADNGKHYESPFICIFETRDGLLVSMREYSDNRLVADLFPGWRLPVATEEP
jgi:uncharacterized protein